LGALVTPSGEDRFIAAPLKLSLAPTAAAAAHARAAVCEWCGQATGVGLPVEAALLLVSELVTNSIRHARIDDDQPLRLNAWLSETTLRLELWDGGTRGTVTRRPPQREDDIGGFGLDLVARLSSAWGVNRDAHGTTVWLELATTRSTTA
jgi:anti-sigma regulatory factor (Ser/Thr protein kinase)